MTKQNLTQEQKEQLMRDRFNQRNKIGEELSQRVLDKAHSQCLDYWVAYCSKPKNQNPDSLPVLISLALMGRKKLVEKAVDKIVSSKGYDETEHALYHERCQHGFPIKGRYFGFYDNVDMVRVFSALGKPDESKRTMESLRNKLVSIKPLIAGISEHIDLKKEPKLIERTEEAIKKLEKEGFNLKIERKVEGKRYIINAEGPHKEKFEDFNIFSYCPLLECDNSEIGNNFSGLISDYLLTEILLDNINLARKLFRNLGQEYLDSPGWREISHRHNPQHTCTAARYISIGQLLGEKDSPILESSSELLKDAFISPWGLYAPYRGAGKMMSELHAYDQLDIALAEMCKGNINNARSLVKNLMDAGLFSTGRFIDHDGMFVDQIKVPTNARGLLVLEALKHPRKLEWLVKFTGS